MVLLAEFIFNAAPLKKTLVGGRALFLYCIIAMNFRAFLLAGVKMNEIFMWVGGRWGKTAGEVGRGGRFCAKCGVPAGKIVNLCGIFSRDY